MVCVFETDVCEGGGTPVLQPLGSTVSDQAFNQAVLTRPLAIECLQEAAECVLFDLPDGCIAAVIYLQVAGGLTLIIGLWKWYTLRTVKT